MHLLGLRVYAPMLPYIRIDYEETEPLTYKAVVLDLRTHKHRFASGDPTRDMNRAKLTAQLAGAPSYMTSSSVDHFVMDGGTLDDSDEALQAMYKLEDPEDLAEVKKALHP